MNTVRNETWSDEDDALDEEFEDVILNVRRHQDEVRAPSELNRKVAAMARVDPIERLTRNWLFGQGPSVVLVILIFVSVALAMLFAILF